MGSTALNDGIKVSIQLYIKLETAYSYTDSVSLNNECPADSARMQSHPSLNSSSHVYTYIHICIHVVYTVCVWMSTYLHARVDIICMYVYLLLTFLGFKIEARYIISHLAVIIWYRYFVSKGHNPEEPCGERIVDFLN